MDTAQLIYSRTANGQAELSARHARLDAAANSLLILIDGKHTQRELLAVSLRMGLPIDCLARLQAGGYIAPIAQAGAAPPVTAARAEAEQHSILYTHLIGAAKAHLGLKGFLFHIKIEKAVSLEDLRALVSPLSDAIAKARGLAPATEFLRQTQALTASGQPA